MSKHINTRFTVEAPGPIDTRMQVSTYAGLVNIPVKYVGLKTYVVDENKEYRYTDTGWVEWSTPGTGGAGVWGAITGVLNDQTDLVAALNLKFDKTGGTITGQTTVLADLYAANFIVWGSTPTTQFPYMQSTIVGEPAGSSIVLNTVFISQVDYDAAVIALTLVPGTDYRITP